MSFNEYVAHVAQCEQRAKTARNEEDKHSWLAMAESWRKSAELRLILDRQAQFVHKAGGDENANEPNMFIPLGTIRKP